MTGVRLTARGEFVLLVAVAAFAAFAVFLGLVVTPLIAAWIVGVPK